MTPEHWDQYMYGLVELTPKTARKKFKQSIKDAWGGCAYCGRTHGSSGEEISLTLDHVRPRSKGGNSLRSNLVAACTRCNVSKASEEWKEWYSRQPFYCADREQRITTWLEPCKWSDPYKFFMDFNGGYCGQTTDDGAGIPATPYCAGGSGADPGGVDQRTLRFLGGTVSAEIYLHENVSLGGILVQNAGESSMRCA